MLRSQTVRIIRRQLLVLLFINVRLVIELQSDQELRNAHAMVLAKGSELNDINAVSTGVQTIELKRRQHL